MQSLVIKRNLLGAQRSAHVSFTDLLVLYIVEVVMLGYFCACSAAADIAT